MFVMSGDELRNFAVLGSTDQLKNILLGGGNPCSVDSKGFTALHYSVWNEHVDCVRVLLANDRGTDEHGTRTSCVNLRSATGLTALHVAVTVCADRGRRRTKARGDNNDADDACDECCRLLILSGKVDATAKDFRGRTAFDLAKDNEKDIPIIIMDLLIRLQEGCAEQEENVDKFVQTNITPYKVQKRRNVGGDLFQSLSNSEELQWVILPSCKKISTLIPKELSMHEQFIFPFAKYVYEANRQNGAEKIRNLVYSLQQAEINVNRTQKLANSREKKWQRELGYNISTWKGFQ